MTKSDSDLSGQIWAAAEEHVFDDWIGERVRGTPLNTKGDHG